MRQIIKTIVFSLIFFNSFALPAQADVWQPPPANPPNSNRPQPLDVSALAQTKAGSLTVQGGLNVGSANQLQVDASGGLTIPNLSVTGNPILYFGGALILFSTADQQSALDIEANLTRDLGLFGSVALINNSNNNQAANSLRLSNAGDNQSIALYAIHSGSGWAGYFEGPVGGSSYLVVGGAVQGGYAGVGDAYFYDDVYVGDTITIAGGSPGAGKVLTADANGLASWQNPAGGYWTDAGSNIYASNITSPSEFRIYDAAYGGVKIRNNNLQLDNNSLINQITDSGSSPVLINDQLMVGRRYDVGCGHYCGGGSDPGVDLDNDENLIFGRVRNNPSGNTNQNLLRLQQGDGNDATIDKFKIDLSGNTAIAGGLTVDTDTLYVDAANNKVGIGTSNPLAKLNVIGESWLDGLTRTDYLWVTEQSPFGYNNVGDAYFAGDVYVGDTITIAGGSPGAGKVLTADASGLASWQNPAGGLPGGTSGQTLRHDGSGWVANSLIYNDNNFVGIGTASPTTKLEVNGAISTSGATIGNNGNTTLDGYLTVGGAYGSTGVTISSAGDISANGNLIVDGNATIGSGNAANTQLALNNSNVGSYDSQLAFQLSGTSLFTIGVDDSDSDKFKISTTALGTNDRLTIDASGLVGINESSPVKRLHVTDSSATTVKIQNLSISVGETANIEFTISTNDTDAWRGGIIRVQRTNSPTNGDTEMQFWTRGNGSPSQKVTIGSTGNVNISGMSQLGSASLNVGAGQNLLYGNIDTNSSGNLLLLQTESVDKFKVDKDGKVTIGGNEIKPNDGGAGGAAIQFNNGNVIIRLGQ